MIQCEVLSRQRRMTDIPIEQRVAVLESRVEQHALLVGHEGIISRVAALETQLAVVQVKIGIYAALGATVGGAIVQIVVHFLKL